MTSRLASRDAASPSRWRSVLLMLLRALSLIIGTVVAVLAQWQPAHNWSIAAQPFGAPLETYASEEVKEAAEAASRAQAQASMLKSGATQLDDGTG